MILYYNHSSDTMIMVQFSKSLARTEWSLCHNFAELKKEQVILFLQTLANCFQNLTLQVHFDVIRDK